MTKSHGRLASIALFSDDWAFVDLVPDRDGDRPEHRWLPGHTVSAAINGPVDQLDRLEDDDFLSHAGDLDIAAIASPDDPLGAGLADLVLEDVEFNGRSMDLGEVYNSSVRAGDRVSVDWDVRNQGSGDADSSEVQIWLADPSGNLIERLATNQTNSIDAGRADSGENSSFDLPDDLMAGRYMIVMFADADEEVLEANEGNNATFFYIDVLAKGMPDLVLDQVQVEGHSIGLAQTFPTTLAAGETIDLDWVVKNVGTGDAGSSSVGIYLVKNGVETRLDTERTTSLDAGETDTNESSTITIPSDLAPGYYTILIRADYDRDVPEANENNNQFFFQIQIAEPLDTVREGTDTTTALDEGDWLNGRIDAEPMGGDTGTSDQQGGQIDKDWYKVILEKGRIYTFEADEQSISTGAVAIALYGSNGVVISGLYNNGSNAYAEGSAPSFQFDTSNQSGATQTYYIAVSAGGSAPAFRTATGDFRVRFTDEGAPPEPVGDRIREGTDTTHSLSVGGSVTGTIDQTGMDGADLATDKDWFKVSLVEGHTYVFDASAGVSGSDTLDAVAIRLYSSNSNAVTSVADGASPHLVYTATETRDYWIAVSAGGSGAWRDKTGDYRISVTDDGPPATGPDDYADDRNDTSAPIGELSVGQERTGRINVADGDDGVYGDKDVFRVDLVAGQYYEFNLEGRSIDGATLRSGLFTIRDQNFNTLETSDAGSDVTEGFLAQRTGTHYIRVGTGGSGSETGGYALSVNTAARPALTDDYADHGGDSGSPGSLTPGGASRNGTIEISGDKDYFTVELVAGQTYAFNVRSFSHNSAGSLGDLAISISDLASFSDFRAIDDGYRSATFTFEADRTGTFFVRVSGDGQTSGGYSVSIGSGRAVVELPPPSPPGDDLTPLQRLSHFLDDDWSAAALSIVDLVTEDEFWIGLRAILKTVDITESLGAADILFTRFGNVTTFTDLARKMANVIETEQRGGDVLEATIVEFADFVAAEVVARIGDKGAPVGFALGGLFGGVGAFAGAMAGFLGGIGLQLVYDTQIAYHLRRQIDHWYDQEYDYTELYPSAPLSNANEAGYENIYFDESFYLEKYPDSYRAIELGLVSSAYAHFISFGIELGYQPSADQTITRADLGFALRNDDPSAFGSSATLIQNLGFLAGDGTSAAELVAAAEFAAAAGAIEGAALDLGLSALAHRKALDLALNSAEGAVALAQSPDSAWALTWSNGADFHQAFAAELAAVMGEGFSDDDWELFVVSSSSGSASDVLARLSSQGAWSERGFDTFGIAEVGGLWVVIAADRSDSYEVRAPQDDGLTTVTQYGGLEGETLYAGLRDGRLFGLGGEDTLHGGAGADLLDGGAGNDVIYAGGGMDTITGGLGQDILFGQGGANTFVFGSQDSLLASYDVIEDFVSGTDRLDLSALYDGTLWLATTVVGTSNYLFADLEQDGVWDFAIMLRNGQVNGDDIFIEALGESPVGLTMWGHDGADTLGGGRGGDVLFGAAGNDYLDGGAGNDYLDGGTGTDRLYGGTGDDTYIIDTQSDLAFENAGEGYDTIVASTGFYLYDNIEALTLAAAAGNGFGVGNALDNVITGNAGSNLLLGGAGNDTVYGGVGNDSLFGEAGTDTLHGGAGIDYLVGGAGNDVLFGEAGADALYGEDGDDVLWGGSTFDTDILVGGAGNDILRGDSGLADYDLLDGDAGNDLYWVDSGDDLTFEDAGGGTDTVYADVKVANAGVYLYDNVENLVLVGTTAFGVGNGLNNLMIGSASGNYLLGGAGNDVLDGRGGNDVLFGEAGNDVFVFQPGTGGDVIGDFTIGSDRIDLKAFGFADFDQLKVNFSQVGADGAINLGNGDFIVLHGVTMANLTAAQFIFPGQASPADALAGIIPADDARFAAPQVAPAETGADTKADADSGPQVLPGTDDLGLDGKAAGPQILPGLDDDAFVVVSKDAAGPQVLPGAETYLVAKGTAGPQVLPGADNGLIAKDDFGPQILPGLDDGDFVVLTKDAGGPQVLPGAETDLVAKGTVGPQVLPGTDAGLAAKGDFGPQILPGLQDGDFVVLSKDAGGPQVLPGADIRLPIKDAAGPQVLPGVGDDDFIVGKAALDTGPQVLPGADDLFGTDALPDGLALRMAIWAARGDDFFRHDTLGDLPLALQPENDWSWA